MKQVPPYMLKRWFKSGSGYCCSGVKTRRQASVLTLTQASPDTTMFIYKNGAVIHCLRYYLASFFIQHLKANCQIRRNFK
jgi:hypothetical protein